MKVYDFLELYESQELADTPAVITVGVFDGVHLGHQKLIKRVMDEKKKYPGSISMVITFSINPKPGKERNVDTLRLREEVMAELGINSFVVIDFSHEFSKISASGFIQMLSHLVKPKAMVVGEDFKFGNPKESASAEELPSLFEKMKIDCSVIVEKAILTEGGEKISSTLVRRVIEKGEMGCISVLTGRNYRVDLMPCPFKLSEGVLDLCIASIHQLLPPPGVYEAIIMTAGGLSSVGECRVSEKKITFAPLTVDDSVWKKMEKDEMQLNSIFIGEKK